MIVEEEGLDKQIAGELKRVASNGSGKCHCPLTLRLHRLIRVCLDMPSNLELDQSVPVAAPQKSASSDNPTAEDLKQDGPVMEEVPSSSANSPNPSRPVLGKTKNVGQLGLAKVSLYFTVYNSIS